MDGISRGSSDYLGGFIGLCSIAGGNHKDDVRDAMAVEIFNSVPRH
jgi:hypothetical protein